MLGLGEENFARLREDKPIVVDLTNVDLTGMDLSSGLVELVIFDATDPAAVEALMRLHAPRGSGQ